MSTVAPLTQPTIGQRALLVAEAVFPVAASQAYIWLLPHDRPRWLDVVFGVVIIGIVAWYTVRRGLLDARIFGLVPLRNHVRAARPIGLFTALVVTGLLLYGWQSEKGLRQDWDILRAVLAYPIWGFVQQGAMFGIIYPRLRLAGGNGAAIVGTALLFGLAHTPNPLLMVGGALMVMTYGLVWRHWPSLIVIAISHGVIGAVCDKALHVSMRVGAHYLE